MIHPSSSKNGKALGSTLKLKILQVVVSLLQLLLLFNRALFTISLLSFFMFYETVNGTAFIINGYKSNPFGVAVNVVWGIEKNAFLMQNPVFWLAALDSV